MVNIDGVVFGHYRTNLAGKDLNRKWDSNEREWVCPEVSAIKNFISDVAKENQIRFILDLHGHSKKYLILIILGWEVFSMVTPVRKILKMSEFTLIFVLGSMLEYSTWIVRSILMNPKKKQLEFI